MWLFTRDSQDGFSHETTDNNGFWIKHNAVYIKIIITLSLDTVELTKSKLKTEYMYKQKDNFHCKHEIIWIHKSN